MKTKDDRFINILELQLNEHSLKKLELEIIELEKKKSFKRNKIDRYIRGSSKIDQFLNGMIISGILGTVLIYLIATYL